MGGRLAERVTSWRQAAAAYAKRRLPIEQRVDTVQSMEGRHHADDRERQTVPRGVRRQVPRARDNRVRRLRTDVFAKIDLR